MDASSFSRPGEQITGYRRKCKQRAFGGGETVVCVRWITEYKCPSGAPALLISHESHPEAPVSAHAEDSSQILFVQPFSPQVREFRDPERGDQYTLDVRLLAIR